MVNCTVLFDEFMIQWIQRFNMKSGGMAIIDWTEEKKCCEKSETFKLVALALIFFFFSLWMGAAKMK